MMEYVVDTHPLVWHFWRPARLGAAAQAAFQAAETGLARLYLPAVVLAELVMVVEKGRVKWMTVTMADLMAQINHMRRSASYEFLPLEPDTVIASRTLIAVPEIFDRLIVAEALRLGLPLITHDTVITNSKVVPVIWH